MKKLLVLFALFPLQSFANDYDRGFIDGAWAATRLGISEVLESKGVPEKTTLALMNTDECQNADYTTVMTGINAAKDAGVLNQISAVLIVRAAALRVCLGNEE